MQTRRIGGTDLGVSVLCYGLGGFGTAVRDGEADRLYSAFRAAGGTFFDTAHCYAFWMPDGLGASERTLGDCLRRHGDRDDVVIATKGGHPDAGADYPRPDRYLAPEVIASDISDSLERIGTDHLDLFLLHRDDTRVPVGEIVHTLNEEVTGGRIRYPGVSNWSTARIAAANEYAQANGLIPLVISQPQFSLAHPNGDPPTTDPAMRFLMPDDAAWHARSQLPVMPYSSTARGYFATDGRSAAKAFDNPITRGRLDRARALAAAKGCTTNQIALAYLLHETFPIFPILGTCRLDHLTDALGAGDVRLTPDEVRHLRDGDPQ